MTNERAAAKQADLIETLEELLKVGGAADVKEACLQLFERGEYLDVPELWNLLGVAAGSTGDHQTALVAFETYLSLQSNDWVAANYICALFATGQTGAACREISSRFQALEVEAKGMVLHSVNQALQLRELSSRDIPECVLSFLKTA